MPKKRFSGEQIVVLLALAGWFVMSRSMPSYLFPDIPAVARAMASLLFDPAFATHTAASVGRIVLSITLALLLGGVLALIPRYVPAANEFIH
jgi:ABC-type nitrate/sulfonate/bicarbonate transport system permease component